MGPADQPVWAGGSTAGPHPGDSPGRNHRRRYYHASLAKYDVSIPGQLNVLLGCSLIDSDVALGVT